MDRTSEDQIDKKQKIIHIDMDAFYASVEQRDHPEFKGKPVIVGGRPEKRGVVATASYEARRYGIHSAMASAQAIKLCPNAIFVKPRFELYKHVSSQIREIFFRYTDLIEPLSLDEAYLDVTEDKLQKGSAIAIAKQIKEAIKTELKLTASAGISTSKFIAKIASDMEKPNGLTFIGPSKIEAFVAQLPVQKFFGVGKVTARRMNALNIFTGADLKALSKNQLITYFGKSGNFYYNIVRGIDQQKVQANRVTKSVGAEDTFSKDLQTLEQLEEELLSLAERVTNRLKTKKLAGCTITIKIKFSDFHQITRNFSTTKPIDSAKDIFDISRNLLQNALLKRQYSIRLLGISISKFRSIQFDPPPSRQQLFLF